MNHSLIYLDSSAILKLVVSEPESNVLFATLNQWPERVSSELARTEVLRSLRRAGVTAPQFRRGQKILGRIGMIPIEKRLHEC